MTLALSELAATAEAFGVSDAQVVGDHAVSHLLALITREAAEAVVLYGGTALARTHLPHGRLSQDIDLLCTAARTEVAAHLDQLLTRGAARQIGRLSWGPSLAQVPPPGAARLSSPDGWSVKVQLVPAEWYSPWPLEERDLEQRYSDPPPARLRVPTRSAFAAWKTVTWGDRGAPRDLWDLAALADAGAVDADALDLYRRLGPTNRAPAPRLFEHWPQEALWQRDLASQTQLRRTAAQAAAAAGRAWARVRAEPPQ